MLVLAVLRDVSDVMLTAGVAFFLVGAVVGVFNELYISSRPTRKGMVFDYGLSHVRLLVTPVLSGLAGVGGVLVTTMMGSFLVGTASAPDLSTVFSLDTYSMGLVVAAIFGLTPGLLLTRLRDRTDAYKEEIEQSAPDPPCAGRLVARRCRWPRSARRSRWAGVGRHPPRLLALVDGRRASPSVPDGRCVGL